MTAKLIRACGTSPRRAPCSSNATSSRRANATSWPVWRRARATRKLPAALDLAESTVKIHVQNIFKKLNMSSRVQVALYAAEQGYGRPPQRS